MLGRNDKGSRRSSDDVNITPVMNLFLVLVPFLLLTTEFVRIAVLELSLPSQNQSSSRQEKSQKPPILVLLAIDDSGFEIKAPGMRFEKILRQGTNFQFSTLARELKRIKAQYGDTEEITIQPSEAILYDTIVDVMDTCRDNGFPNISVSG
ncbi:MAG: biopolymer transporter ExbD [Deferribacteres bacterium]|nr:biopolymer transporter ExbD [candidate division KSB1 bacterium]MCB9509242.1 biopolymer transporter ExbD [Deferribacteres bacterium]